MANCSVSCWMAARPLSNACGREGMRARVSAAMSEARSCRRRAVGAATLAAGAGVSGAGADSGPASRLESVSSAVATTSTPFATGRLERIRVPSPNAMRALARASRDVGAWKRLMFMRMHL